MGYLNDQKDSFLSYGNLDYLIIRSLTEYSKLYLKFYVHFGLILFLKFHIEILKTL